MPVYKEQQQKAETLRFLEKIRDDESGCHLWVGNCLAGKNNREPYGMFWTRRHGKPTSMLAHRYAWWFYGRYLPPGHHLHHKCGNTLCVNLEHLELVTPKAHARRHIETLRASVYEAAMARSRKVWSQPTCRHGHPRDDYYIDSRGYKCCRQCRRNLERRRAAAAKAKRSLGEGQHRLPME